MKKLLFLGLFALPLWAQAQTNRTYSSTNLDNMFITNRVRLIPSSNITITTNDFRTFTIAATGFIDTNSVLELTNGRTSYIWMPPDVADRYYTNVLCTFAVSSNALYTVNFTEFTVATNTAALDSKSFLYVMWTDPDDGVVRTSRRLNDQMETYTVYTYSPLTFHCKSGTSLIVSNYSIDSWDAGDNSSTNYVKASIWGKR